MNAVLMEPQTEREQWLEWRKGGVGASDVAVILGLHPKRTALDLYAEKIGEGEPQKETLNMFLGKVAEPWLATEYEEATGFRLVQTQVPVVCPTRPHLRATLDGIRTDSRPVELKAVFNQAVREFGEENSDELPSRFLAQATGQMLAADEDCVDFGVGSTSWPSLRVYTVRRDESLCRIVLDKVDWFWDCVTSRTPPPITQVSDLQHLPLYGDDPNPIALGFADHQAWDEYKALGVRISELESQRDGYKLAIYQALGSHATGLLPTGDRIVRKMINRKAQMQKACTYPQLYFKKAGE